MKSLDLAVEEEQEVFGRSEGGGPFSEDIRSGL